MSTYAVIETGGKQYRVEKGSSLLVDRLDAKQGEKVALRAVMFRDKEVVAEPKQLEKVKVEATVAEHVRGPKVKVFKYKAKKGYRRRAGHRAELTRLDVTELKAPGGRAAAPKTEPQEKAAPAEKKPAAEKGSAEGKPATKKAKSAKPSAEKAKSGKTAEKKPPAKKPPAKKPAAKKDADDGS